MWETIGCVGGFAAFGANRKDGLSESLDGALVVSGFGGERDSGEVFVGTGALPKFEPHVGVSLFFDDSVDDDC